MLEQDKRVRQQFRKCLEPVASVVEPEAFYPLVTMHQPNSLSWLLNFLVECLLESDYTENIGAAILLSGILPDGDPRVSDVEEHLLGAPASYIAALFEARVKAERRRHQPFRKSEWFLDIVIKVLLREEWSNLPVGGIEAGVEILRLGGKTTFTVAARNGLSEAARHLLGVLLTEDAFPAQQKVESCYYGLIRGRRYAADWTNRWFKQFAWWSGAEESLRNAPGILQLVYRIFRFADSKHIVDLRSAIECVGISKISVFTILPGAVRAHIPIDDKCELETHATWLCRLDEQELRTLLRDKQLGSKHLTRPVVAFALGPKTDIQQWRKLLEELPAVAIQLWGEALWREFRGVRRRRPKLLDQEEAVQALVDKMLECPKILHTYPQLWGRLIQKAPRREHELRQAFRSASAFKNVDFRYWISEFHSFRLHLEAERSLLPHVVVALLAAVQTPDPAKRLNEAKQYTEGLAVELPELDDVINDRQESQDIRAAAAILAVLHPKSQGLTGHYQVLGQLYGCGVGAWYVAAVRMCLTLLGSERDLASRSIVGCLLERGRSDYRGRAELEELLGQWRETSYAPVQTAGLVETWLSGS